jgi:hypothetical protein
MNEQLDMQVDEIDEVDKSSIAHTLVNNSVDLDKFDTSQSPRRNLMNLTKVKSSNMKTPQV